MSQDRLLRNVISVMIMAGYEVSELFAMRPKSFDIIASNGDQILVLKVISHIDSISEENARDLDRIARNLSGSPLIVGERARDAELERGAVYVRYGIFAINYPTLHDYFVEGSPPLIYASPGGLYVNISGERLRELRENSSLSLGDLGQILGVSRRTVAKYEAGMGTTIEIALRIEETFDSGVVEPIDLIQYNSHFEEPAKKPDEIPIRAVIEEMGMDIQPMYRAPFQALVRYDSHTILTGYGSSQKLSRRAGIIGNISQVTRTHAMCIMTDDQRQRRIGRTLMISEDSLLSLDEPDDLINLILN
ncbi:transcriptional regulator [Methanospirillum stamsii]|uniref:Putative HTH-type transcriptional regulatory protein DLD82_13700 n=1 Tax=Methanospirillum stamsii TaxID=1277351 RepID=A0A2V2MV06_9EURY|nr:transcriptional regulator [Methanospirillum stamsii]PWR71209.1 transcriptional regulator [Methanospirillum stamsii]